jgi:hypothetical protein
VASARLYVLHRVRLLTAFADMPSPFIPVSPVPRNLLLLLHKHDNNIPSSLNTQHRQPHHRPSPTITNLYKDHVNLSHLRLNEKKIYIHTYCAVRPVPAKPHSRPATVDSGLHGNRIANIPFHLHITCAPNTPNSKPSPNSPVNMGRRWRWSRASRNPVGWLDAPRNAVTLLALA